MIITSCATFDCAHACSSQVFETLRMYRAEAHACAITQIPLHETFICGETSADAYALIVDVSIIRRLDCCAVLLGTVLSAGCHQEHAAG